MALDSHTNSARPAQVNRSSPEQVALAYIEEIWAAMEAHADILPVEAWAIVRSGILKAGERVRRG